jgi:hypothetical protein
VKILPEPALTLLHEAAYGALATHSTSLPGYPYATVVPYVVDECHRPVVCLSALAEHTRNVLADPRVSLSVLQPGAGDVQAAARLTLVADAEPFEPAPDFLARYLRYEPGAAQNLTLDCTFLRLNPKRIRFIAGFGQMGWIEAQTWADLPRLPAKDERERVREASQTVRSGVGVLGVDLFGIDYAVARRRHRQRFPGAPVLAENLKGLTLRMAAQLD